MVVVKHQQVILNLQEQQVVQVVVVLIVQQYLKDQEEQEILHLHLQRKGLLVDLALACERWAFSRSLPRQDCELPGFGCARGSC